MIIAGLKSMRGFLLRLIMAGVFGIGANACAADCEKLLVPDFALPGLDTTTDLAYLAAITPENFSRHKINATPKMKHLGVLLPIASDDARLLMERDGGLASERGQAARILLYLFERDWGVQLLRGG